MLAAVIGWAVVEVAVVRSQRKGEEQVSQRK